MLEISKPMTDGEVSRAEWDSFIRTYETRHAELQVALKEIVTDRKTEISALNIEVQKLKLDLQARSIDIWKIIATSSVSILVGYIAFWIQHNVIH